MAHTRKVLLSLHTEVADRLGQEKNKSAVVDALAAAHYGITFESGSSASTERQSILDSLTGALAPAPVAVAVAEDVTPTIVEPIVPVEPQRGEAQPDTAEPIVAGTAPSDGFVRVVSAPDFVSVVQPLDPVVPASEVEPAQPQSVDVPAPLVEALTETVEPELIAAPLPEPEPVIEPVVEPVAVAPVVEEVVEAPEEYEVGSRVDSATGYPLCPDCDQPRATPICLNCL